MLFRGISQCVFTDVDFNSVFKNTNLLLKGNAGGLWFMGRLSTKGLQRTRSAKLLDDRGRPWGGSGFCWPAKASPRVRTGFRCSAKASPRDRTGFRCITKVCPWVRADFRGNAKASPRNQTGDWSQFFLQPTNTGSVSNIVFYSLLPRAGVLQSLFCCSLQVFIKSKFHLYFIF